MAESSSSGSNTSGLISRLKSNAAAKSAPLEQKIAAAQQKYDATSSKGKAGRKAKQAAGNELNAAKAGMKKEMARTNDILEGAQFGADILGEEGLGRMGTDPEIQATMQKFKDISEQGLSRQELAAERAQMTRDIDSSTQTMSRGLQAKLARMGVKGAVAGQQLMGAELQGAQQKGQVAQNLFLKSEQMKREGLQNYSSKLGEIKSFDLGQAAKEKDIIMQSGLGFAQMGSSERTAAYAAEQSKLASIASARASRPSCFLGDNKVELENGILINFSDLDVGMVLKDGNMVLAVSKHMALDDLYNYKGVKVTGDHFVLENNFFIPVRESENARAINYPLDALYVWNIITTSGIIEINGVTFSDWEDEEIKAQYEEICAIFKGKVQSKLSGE